MLVDTVIKPPYFGKTRYFLWRYDHLHEGILVISLLLEMNILVMVIILMCLACMPERNPGKPLPWVGVSGLRRDGYVRYGMVRYIEW